MPVQYTEHEEIINKNELDRFNAVAAANAAVEAEEDVNTNGHQLSNIPDLEKNVNFANVKEDNPLDPQLSTSTQESTTIKQPRPSISSFASSGAYFNRLYEALNVETIGISPIPESHKYDTSLGNIITMWFSANLGVAALSLGTLGPVLFGLDFPTSVWTIVMFNFVGTLPVAYFSVFGSKTGLRQMVLTRFLGGNLTARFFSLLNLVACVGWTAINTGAAAQILSIVNRPHNCPPWAGCLILLGSTVIVTFMGYKIVHLYEKWAWVPCLFVYFVIIARLTISKKFSYGSNTGNYKTTTGDALSFGATIFSFAAGWAPYAADFTVYMPQKVNSWKIFFGVAFGLFFSLTFTLILGSACAISLQNSPEWQTLYDSHGLGGLMYGIMVKDSLHGFGQFCCVVLAMTTVATNTPNMYSISLCAQALWEPLAKIPRPICTLIGSGITLIISICAYYKFLTFMSNMMDAIGYFIGIYLGITLTDFVVFHRCKFTSIQVENWKSWDNLPIGIAGLCAVFAGAVGVAMGMDESYWVGQIARHVGEFGGDIGWELGFCFSALTYALLRPVEKRFLR